MTEPAPAASAGSDPSLLRFRAVLEAGLAALEARREEVNELNVFPVADGDTGDNMVLTLRAVLHELDRLASGSVATGRAGSVATGPAGAVATGPAGAVATGPAGSDPHDSVPQDSVSHPDGAGVPQVGRDQIVASVARAALLGARGTSGVILSQLIRGAAEELASRPGELVDPVLISAALARAVDQAYGSVREPVEGTILTVVREMGVQVASDLARVRDARLPPDASPEVQNWVIAGVVERALKAGESSVRRGPDLLPALRRAGVVDAGGYALTVMLAGILGALRGGEPPEVEHPESARVTRPHHFSSTYRYCTSFAVTGTELEQWRFAPALERLGDSVLLVGDRSTLKVHLHTDDPDAATALLADHGTISHVDVADMRAQMERLEERRGAPSSPAPLCDAVAVAAGAGLRALFESLGVRALEGWSASAPTSLELLAAIHSSPAEQVVVLPNGEAALSAANRAAALSDKTVRVVPSLSPQAGLAAAVTLDPTLDADGNARAMLAALEHVRTGAVGPAPLDDAQGRFRAGDAVGLVEDEIVAWGRPREALREVLEQLAQDAELITCLRGAEAPLDDGTVQALAHGDVEFELSDGGQSGHWWLLAAE